MVTRASSLSIDFYQSFDPGLFTEIGEIGCVRLKSL
jgi:hypothetical protein